MNPANYQLNAADVSEPLGSVELDVFVKQNRLGVRFLAESGTIYQFQRRAALDSTWVDYGDPIHGDGQWHRLVVDEISSSMFFRIKVIGATVVPDTELFAFENRLFV